MPTFIGFDLHRAQITYDALNTDSGETKTGRIRPAKRDTGCLGESCHQRPFRRSTAEPAAVSGASGAHARALDSRTLALAALLEMSVDGGARDVEDLCDVLDAALAGVVELLGRAIWSGVEPRSTSVFASVGGGGGEAVAGVGDQEFAVEFGEDGEHPEHRTPLPRHGVDALLDDVQADAAFAELGAEGHEVQDRSAEAVQPGHLQRVVVVQEPKDGVELRSAGLRAARVVDADVLMGDAGATERVDLVVESLVSGRSRRGA